MDPSWHATVACSFNIKLWMDVLVGQNTLMVEAKITTHMLSVRSKDTPVTKYSVTKFHLQISVQMYNSFYKVQNMICNFLSHMCAVRMLDKLPWSHMYMCICIFFLHIFPANWISLFPMSKFLGNIMQQDIFGRGTSSSLVVPMRVIFMKWKLNLIPLHQEHEKILLLNVFQYKKPKISALQLHV